MSQISGRAPTFRLRDPGRSEPTRDRFFNGMVGDPPWMEVIYSHSTFPGCTVDLPLCAGGDEDCTRPKSMIRQRLGHSVRHDTTGGDVYLRCLPLSFPARSFWKNTWRPRMLLRRNHRATTSISWVSLWLVYAAVLVTSKTTILRFQPEWKGIKTQAGRLRGRRPAWEKR